MIICVVAIGYILVFILYFYIIKHAIAKNSFSGLKRKQRKISFTLCGIFGMIVARNFLKDWDNRTIMETTCFLCFLFSYVALLGILNIFKYQYIKKHPEILDK